MPSWAEPFSPIARITLKRADADDYCVWLIKDERLPGNYFAPDAYIKGDFGSGLIESRRGDRL